MAERKRIYLCLAHMSEEGIEQKYIKEAFDTNWVVPLGPNVNGFEEDLTRFLARKETNDNLNDDVNDYRVVALSSGTAAIHLALIGCGVGPGDEVIVQSFTFCASSHPVTYVGATPVFVDSERETWNMDPELLEFAIKDRIAKTGKKPKAIIPVALYGMPYRIDEIMEIADRYEILVIEDAAEGFGSKFKGQMLGTFGRYGALSFNGNKMITTSGGGALICGPTSEQEGRGGADTIMWYATQARESYPYYQHEKIGYNYRMSNICAGIGRGQMTVANKHIEHHKHVQSLYEELLANVPGITVHSQPKNCVNANLNDNANHNDDVDVNRKYDSNYWLCTITLTPELRIKGQENAYKSVIKSAVGGAAGVVHEAETATTDCQPNDNVEALRVYLDRAGIEARPVWKPMHCQPVYRQGEVKKESLGMKDGCVVCQTSDSSVAYINGISEEIFKIGMCLPAGPYVSDDDVRYIVDCIKEAIVK